MSAVRQWVGGFIIVAGTVTVAPRVMAQQEGTTPDSVPLAARVDELEQQIRVLKRLRELEGDSIAAAAKDKASVTANGKDGFSIKSADGKYVLKLRGYAAVRRPLLTAATKPRPCPTPSSCAAPGRSSRPRSASIFGFRIMPDFGGGRPCSPTPTATSLRRPPSRSALGKFKPPVGLERLQSATDILFAERGLPTNLVPNRDIGLQLGGDSRSGVLTYAVGVFNGVVDLGNGDGDLNDAKDLAARVFLQPFTQGSLKGLGFGVAATTGTEQGGLSGTTLSSGLPSYRSPGQQTVFRYRVDAAAPLNSVIADGTAQPAGAPGLLLQRTVRPAGRVRHLPPGSPPRPLRRGAHPQGLAGERLVLPHRGEGRVPQSHAQEGLRSEAEGLRRPRAGRAVRRARRRRRRLPHLRQSAPARSPRRRARASASTGT